MGRVVGLEPSVKRQPAEEIVVRGFGHAGRCHVDVGLSDVRIVKGQTVERKTIRPICGGVGDDTERGQPGLREDGGVVHETPEVVRERNRPVGLVARDIVHQRLEGRPKRMLKHEVQFGVQFLKHGEVEDAAGGRINAAPSFSGRKHLGGLDQLGIIR